MAQLDPARDIIAGVVGRADLTLGRAVRPVLEAHVEASDGRFVGIRHVALDAGATEAMSSSEFREGVDVLLDMGLTLDVWSRTPQLRAVEDLAGHHPGLTIVVNHLGGPVVDDGASSADAISAWRFAVSELAHHDNVVLKLGGIGYLGGDGEWGGGSPSSETIAHRWTSAISHCVDLFGPTRCMFESNFPVDRRWLGYVPLWNAFRMMTADLGAAERRALFHDTAARTYGLSLGHRQ